MAHHLGDLVCHYKDVRDLIRVTFSQPDEQMMLVYHRLPQRIAKAARLDGKWALVTNQPLERGHSPVAYMDWMVAVYHNHRHVERRMRNLKSNLPIRPLYVHRDDETVALCFASLLALTIYTLIERDVQADPVLAAQGLRTTDTLLAATSGWGLSAFLTPSGYVCFWFDTLTPVQRLIRQRLHLIDPGTLVPRVRQNGYGDDMTRLEGIPSSFLPRWLALPLHVTCLQPPAPGNSHITLTAVWASFAIVNVLFHGLFVMLC